MALPIGGRDKIFTRRKWLDFAEYCEIPEKAAKRLLSDQIHACDTAKTLIAGSFVDDESKEKLEQILDQHTNVLKG